jgi:hypothetical protein
MPPMAGRFRLSGDQRLKAWAVGARSAFDLTGGSVASDGLFPAPAWKTLDAPGAIARDMGRVRVGFRRSLACASRAVAAGDNIDDLPVGCTEDVEPYRLPLRQVTPTDVSIDR